MLVACQSGAAIDIDAAGDEGESGDRSCTGPFEVDHAERRGDRLREGREQE